MRFRTWAPSIQPELKLGKDHGYLCPPKQPPPAPLEHVSRNPARRSHAIKLVVSHVWV